MPTTTKNVMQKPDPVSFSEALLYWLKLGHISFGGPAGQISMMHQELVEKRRWISEHRFLHALNYTMVLPGARGAAVGDLYRLADARHQGWYRRRLAVCSTLAIYSLGIDLGLPGPW